VVVDAAAVVGRVIVDGDVLARQGAVVVEDATAEALAGVGATTAVCRIVVNGAVADGGGAAVEDGAAEASAPTTSTAGLDAFTGAVGTGATS